MHPPTTVARLVGPTIASVCVALLRGGSPLRLQATFPRMLLADVPSDAPARAYVASSGGAVEVRIEGSSDRAPLVSLATELACPALIASRLPAEAWGHTTLVVDRSVVWEEERGGANASSFRRLVCAPIGIDVRWQAGTPADEGELVAAWVRVDAYVKERLGAAVVRALSFEGR